jgi:flagellar biosynthetic protein FlhB
MADSSKTEKPTDKKVRDAREKGQIAKSPEVSSIMQLLGFLLVMYFLSRSILGIMFGGFYSSFEAAGSGKLLTEGKIFSMLTGSGFNVLAALTPMFMILCGIALMTGALQSGFTWSGKAIRFDPGRINPIMGFGKIFSTRSWVELFKALFKITVVFVLLYNMFMTEKDKLMQLAGMDIYTITNYSAYLFMEVIKKTVFFLALVAVADYIWQNHDYMDNLKMTKEEVKEEVRQTEGDLRTKAKIKNWHKKKMRHRMMDALKDATFVTVNPTHYAVALKYERGMKAPKLLAKGADHIAKKIREEAKKLGIPVIPNPELTRAIYFSTEVNKFIPAKLFKAVAKVLVFIYRMEKDKKRGR